MSSIFKFFLGKNLLRFFDDILIYNKSWEENVHHANWVLKLLEEKKLYENPSMCTFGVYKMKYLDNLLSNESLKLGPYKIKSMI